MAKKSESIKAEVIPVDYQKLISEICEILQVDESKVVESVRQHAQAAKRPIVAATVFIDPILQEPKVVFIKNTGDVSFAEAEYTLNSAIDFVKGLKAQETAKKKLEEEGK